MPLAVHRHEGGTAERAVDRRVCDLGGEQLRSRGDCFDVGRAGDEPRVHGWHPGNRLIGTQPSIDRIGV